ncbi:MAG: endonuclease III [Coriobacteriales bacterium]|jgi:endonuclease-3|nr:endonuclease III [Coriobacteriales bacterium]
MRKSQRESQATGSPSRPSRRESQAARRQRALAVAERMDARYPDAQCALHFSNPFTLTIAVLLSAQTTDVAVNKVTPQLFARWPTPAAMAAAEPAELEPILKSIGLYRSKARNCVACARTLMAEFAGEVPRSIPELMRLPGVGRKTANVVQNNAFGIVEGIAVDTHVFRIAHRLGFSPAASDTPEKVERDLLALYPPERWGPINHQWVLFGREVCIARRPRCPTCPLTELCPSATAVSH